MLVTMQNYYVTINNVRLTAHFAANLRATAAHCPNATYTVRVCDSNGTAQLGYTSVHNTLEEALKQAHWINSTSIVS